MWLCVANASWLDSVIFMLLFTEQCSICISCSRQVLLFQVNNILIVNLAISDLFLCTIVSPLTLIELLYKRWTGPKAPWLCCLSGMGPACITFVSTLTITGIAIDRWDIFWPIWLLPYLISFDVNMHISISHRQNIGLKLPLLWKISYRLH